MLVIPAIDILEGRVVRLTRGEYDRVTDYGGRPTDFFRAWADAGARRIHVVLLGAARSGKRSGEDDRALREMLAGKRALGVEVQVGGGIRDIDGFRRVRDLGADYIILGTAAISEMAASLAGAPPAPGGGLLAGLKDRGLAGHALIGLDTRGGKAAVSGWEKTLEPAPRELLGAFSEAGFRRCVLTATARDGTLEGPDSEALARASREAPDVSFIAAGGIGRLSDLERLEALDLPNLEGVITGKAIYEGKLDLAEAISRFQEKP